MEVKESGGYQERWGELISFNSLLRAKNRP
jgi:hypothetical protein